jgi:hypothetical protein
MFDVLDKPGYKKLLDVTAKLLPKAPAFEAKNAILEVLECATKTLLEVLESAGYKKLLDVTAKLLPKAPALEAKKAILEVLE